MQEGLVLATPLDELPQISRLLKALVGRFGRVGSHFANLLTVSDVCGPAANLAED